ncbi:hypothetical protein GE300_20075 [Rhodobacteraceae bacterium 2CG4]|uniref:Uncharacterized protein n=1 Tax=Halovulum marinum TaxID=2662447 RepID=A0A6L5Z5L6_9RHOB|nr:hypothetical protein [Halovulum marinum]MSU91876.1 hypothetical protein [Halovulum marinum]
MVRSLFSHALALYIGAGLFGGLLMAQAVPATTPVGVAYYTVTWPQQIYCARADRDCRRIDEQAPAWLVPLMFEDPAR